MPELMTKKDKMQTVRDLLKQYEPQLTAALPIHRKKDAERMARIVLTEIARNPRLLDCTPQSLMGAILQAAAFGLDPGIMGDCWLIPRKNRRKGDVHECNFQLGYKGLLKLCRRSGEIGSVQARVVHEKDTFEYAFGLKPKLEHVPSPSEDGGETRFVYAVMHLKDGTAMFDVWTKGQIEAHRKRYSQSPDDGPWQTAWDEMAKKTVLIRVCKLAPASVELQAAIALDEMAEVGEPQDLSALVTPGELPEKNGALDRLTDELRKNGEKKPEESKGGEVPSARQESRAHGVDARSAPSPTTAVQGTSDAPAAPAAQTNVTPPAPAPEKADRGEAAGAGPAGVDILRSNQIDAINALYDALGIGGPSKARQRQFLWNRYVGQGVKETEAAPDQLAAFIKELENLKLKMKKNGVR